MKKIKLKMYSSQIIDSLICIGDEINEPLKSIFFFIKIKLFSRKVAFLVCRKVLGPVAREKYKVKSLC